MAVTIMLPTLPVMADAVGTFEEAVVQYGEQAGNYTYDITAAGEQTKEVILFGNAKGDTYTETHIREEANATSRSLLVVPSNTNVSVWGVTANGWTKVFYEDEQGSVFFGYIRSDLLELA